MNPGVVDSNWSHEVHSPGVVVFMISRYAPRVRHGVRVALPLRQAGHGRGLPFARCFGRVPFLMAWMIQE